MECPRQPVDPHSPQCRTYGIVYPRSRFIRRRTLNFHKSVPLTLHGKPHCFNPRATHPRRISFSTIRIPVEQVSAFRTYPATSRSRANSSIYLEAIFFSHRGEQKISAENFRLECVNRRKEWFSHFSANLYCASRFLPIPKILTLIEPPRVLPDGGLTI